jgi:hypothetical protein
MSIAFHEHMLFSLPVDGYATAAKGGPKKGHASEDDTSVGDPSYHNSFDYGKAVEESCQDECEFELSLGQVSLVESSNKISLDGYLATMKKPLLMNASINIFYQCYSVVHDKLDPSCLSILIMRSMKEQK